MKNKLLVAVLFSVKLFSAEHNYTVKVSQSEKAMDMCVNNQYVSCECGKAPQAIIFFYGNPKYYCLEHLPEIEYVRPVGPKDIERLLGSLDHSWTGAHQ